MKKQEILEIIVGNPQAIFLNGNWVEGKYSEFPNQFQVVGMSSYDKSQARVRAVNVTVDYWLKTEDGKFVEDEDGKNIRDTRPFSERAHITIGEIKSMPLRLIIKSDKTEASILADYVANAEAQEQAQQEREARHLIMEQNINELKSVMVAHGLLTVDEAERLGQWGYFNLDLRDEKIPALTAVLKSALVEVGV